MVNPSPTSVLLVDDNKTFLRIASLFLNEIEDIEVVDVVSEGNLAVEKILALVPDIVLIDLVMPDTHGMRIIPILRDVLPEVGIVTLTLHDTKEYREAALAVGADAFISKPEMCLKLLPAIQKIIDNKHK